MPPLVTVPALLLLCLLFGRWQNTRATVGGDISLAKTLWIFLTLTFFFLLPAALWSDPTLPAESRRFHGFFLLSWLVRGVIEIPMLLLTRWWRCGYGITHTVFMLLAEITPGLAMARDPASQALLPWTIVVLACEALNAHLFSRAGSPETGVYFAGADPVFRRINHLTWLEISVLLPALVWWLLRHA